MDASDALIFALVVGLRIFVPLLIFRFPLPAIIAALLIDAADKSIFELFTDVDLENYQSYDKALDIYYLSIAYIATMRNWSNVFAVQVSRFLWYYRLIGNTIFELTGLRALLLIFPNTFEYFFIYVEAARTRWNLQRLTNYHLIAAAAAIWVVIKLPQEYWIHIAQRDTTDTLLYDVLGMPDGATWGEAIAENLWVIPVVILLAVAIYLIVRTILARLPKPDWPTVFDADVNADEYAWAKPAPLPERHWREGLLEKIILVGFVTVIFASMLPNIEVTVTQMVVGVSVVIAANAFISHWLARRGTEWRSVGLHFVIMAAINFGLAITAIFILPIFDGDVQPGALLFFTLLLTLLVSCFDRYRPVYDLRLAASSDQQR